LLLAAVYQGTAAGLIEAKAWLAPVLIERAWQRTLSGAGWTKPWPWADTWPVARLRVPALGIDLPVLAGDGGHALAFAPGHSLSSATPGAAGRAVIGGHRDTHFAFLRDLTPGERLQLQLPTGEWRHYRVDGGRVVDIRRQALRVQRGRESLLLVTCYPFDTLRSGGPLRFTVAAHPVSARRT
jgi:sortase A